MFKKNTCSRRLLVPEDYIFKTITFKRRFQEDLIFRRLHVQEDYIFKTITFKRPFSRRLRVQDDYTFKKITSSRRLHVRRKCFSISVTIAPHSSGIQIRRNFKDIYFRFEDIHVLSFLFITRFYGKFTADR